MEEQLRTAKVHVRRAVRERLLQLASSVRIAQSQAVCTRFTSLPIWTTARQILFFAPLPDEIDIWPLVKRGLDDGKILALPRFSPVTQLYAAATVRDLRTDLQPGQLGIREPNAACDEFPLNRLDLVLVPGVAFDPHGHRLGRGKGFYDRLLVDVCGVKCGVAFDEQIVDEMPVGPHDVPLNCILTPTRWFICRPARGA